MQAIVFDDFGEAKVFRPAEVSLPILRRDDTLVGVMAAGRQPRRHPPARGRLRQPIIRRQPFWGWKSPEKSWLPVTRCNSSRLASLSYRKNVPHEVAASIRRQPELSSQIKTTPLGSRSVHAVSMPRTALNSDSVFRGIHPSPFDILLGECRAASRRQFCTSHPINPCTPFFSNYARWSASRSAS